MTNEEKELSPRECSFCERNETNVVLLIKGNTGFICDGCTYIAARMLADRIASNLKPVKDVIAYLDKSRKKESI